MAAETSSLSSGVEATYVPSVIAPVRVAEGWQPLLFPADLEKSYLVFQGGQSESKGAHHHSPKVPTNGKLLSFRVCKKTLAITRGKRVRLQAEVPG